jgi:hypothetical protein
MAIDKSTWNRKIKVSQSTIDTIKKQGMTASLKSASSNKSSEYQEALRRMYGDKRVSAATGAAPKKMTGQASGYRNPKQAGPMTGQPSGYRNPKQAGPAAGQPSGYRNSKPAATVKKSGGISTTSKAIAGGVAAAALTVASRGRLAGMAARLSPGLMKNKVAQAALTGEIKKTATKAAAKKVAPKTVSQSGYESMVAAKRGQAAAAAGKSVTPEQFSAMSAAAKTAAKKAPVKKTAAKKAAAPAPKKTGLTAGRRFDANAPKAKAPKKPKAQ